MQTSIILWSILLKQACCVKTGNYRLIVSWLCGVKLLELEQILKVSILRNLSDWLYFNCVEGGLRLHAYFSDNFLLVLLLYMKKHWLIWGWLAEYPQKIQTQQECVSPRPISERDFLSFCLLSSYHCLLLARVPQNMSSDNPFQIVQGDLIVDISLQSRQDNEGFHLGNQYEPAWKGRHYLWSEVMYFFLITCDYKGGQEVWWFHLHVHEM